MIPWNTSQPTEVFITAQVFCLFENLHLLLVFFFMHFFNVFTKSLGMPFEVHQKSPPQKKKCVVKNDQKWPKTNFFWKKKPAGANFSENFLEIYPSPSPRQLWQRKVYFGKPAKIFARSKRPICDEGIDRADDFWKIDESSLKRRHVLHHLLLALWRPGSHRELPDVLFVNVCDVQKDTHSYIWGEVQYSMHNPQQHIHFNHPEKHRVVPKMSLCRSCSPRDSPIPKKNIYFIRYYSRRVS